MTRRLDGCAETRWVAVQSYRSAWAAGATLYATTTKLRGGGDMIPHRSSDAYSRVRTTLEVRRGFTEKFYPQQGALKVLLVFSKDDATVTAFRAAAGQLGYECSLARTLSSCVDAFQSRCHDLVIVDNRDPRVLDGEAIGRALRNVKCSQYSVIVAMVKRSETEKQDSSVLPFINAGYDRWLVETSNLAPAVSELLLMETAEVQPRKQLWAYHSFLLMAERSRELCIITDFSHHIVYANRAVERAVGSSARDLQGRSVYDLVHVDSRERLLSAAIKGREWEGVATVAPRRNSETLMLQCRVMPNGAVGRPPANLVFMLEPPAKRGSEAGMSGRGSVPSVRRGSADMRSVCSDGRIFWSTCKNFLCCRARSSAIRQKKRPMKPKRLAGTTASRRVSVDGLRRQSVTKLNALSIEAPITKVVTLISQAQEMSSPEVSLMLDKVVDILRTTELYSPVVREDKLRPDDPVTSDLISALLQAGGNVAVPTTRRSSNDSAVARGMHGPRGSRVLASSAATTQLSTLLDTSLLWEFDLFKLEELSGRRPLTHLGMNLMEHFEASQTLNVDVSTIHNWLSIIEMNYRSSNTYHNSSHAADVMQASAAFLERERLQRILDPLDAVCCLIAAAVHDVDHPGRSSAFLCNSDHDLAILYNDICVLESHHAALAFKLTVSDERVNIFKGLERDVYKMVRLSVIDMVLATEMTKHFEHLAKFVNVFSKPQRDDDDVTQNRSRRSLLQLGADSDGAPMTQENIALAKRMLIKCADVSNPARPLRMCVEWALRIAEEYFQQTDEEKEKHLPVVMPMFDRSTCSIPKSQIGFMDFIINDMFEAWEAFLNLPQLMYYTELNYRYWGELENMGYLSVDVQRMEDMMMKYGYYGDYTPPAILSNNMPKMTNLAKFDKQKPPRPPRDVYLTDRRPVNPWLPHVSQLLRIWKSQSLDPVAEGSRMAFQLRKENAMSAEQLTERRQESEKNEEDTGMTSGKIETSGIPEKREIGLETTSKKLKREKKTSGSAKSNTGEKDDTEYDVIARCNLVEIRTRCEKCGRSERRYKEDRRRSDKRRYRDEWRDRGKNHERSEKCYRSEKREGSGKRSGRSNTSGTSSSRIRPPSRSNKKKSNIHIRECISREKGKESQHMNKRKSEDLHRDYRREKYRDKYRDRHPGKYRDSYRGRHWDKHTNKYWDKHQDSYDRLKEKRERKRQEREAANVEKLDITKYLKQNDRS